MSHAAEFRADYRRMLEKDGEPIVIRRGNVSVTALGKVKGYKPDELSGGVNQGEIQVMLLAEDLEKAGFPVPPAPMDEIDWLGLTTAVLYEPTLRRVGTVTIAYDLLVK